MHRWIALTTLAVAVTGGAVWGQGWNTSTVENVQSAVKGGMVELRVYREDEDVAGVCAGVLIEPFGRVATTAHALLGATRVEAIIPGAREPVSLQPITVSGELNLAVCDLSARRTMLQNSIEPCELISEEPQRGQKVWLAALVNNGMRTYPATVENTALFGALEDRTRDYLRHSAMSKWIEVEPEADTARSATAAFTEDGKFAGLVAWVWIGDKTPTPVLASVHLAELMSAGSAPLATWGQFQDRIAGNPPLPLQFPRLAVEPSSADRDVRAAAQLIDRTLQCPLCDGWGTIEEKKRTGYETIGGGLRKPVYEYEDKQCPRCEGSGLASGEVLDRAIGRMVDTLARLREAGINSADERAATMSNASEALGEVAGRLTTAMAERLNPQAEELFTAGATKIGEPILLIGEYVPSVTVPGRSDPMIGVRVAPPERERHAHRRSSSRSNSGDSRRVLVTDPVHVAEGRGEYALVGGLLAGYVQYKRELPLVPILTRGIVVPLDPVNRIDQEIAEREAERRREERERRRSD